MIGYLRGEILEHLDGRVLVTLGDSKGSGAVGYLVTVPQSAEYEKYLPGQNIELFVHAHIREDAFDLYGFSTKFEKSLFLTLLSVSGIGPKGALGILSRVEAGQLVTAITSGDQALLTRVPGIGKKTAERVVVELRDTIQKKLDMSALGQPPRLQPNSNASQLATSGALLSGEEARVFQDAKEALLGLGFRDQDIHQLLNRVIQNAEIRPKRAEDLVRTALRQLS